MVFSTIPLNSKRAFRDASDEEFLTPAPQPAASKRRSLYNKASKASNTDIKQDVTIDRVMNPDHHEFVEFGDDDGEVDDGVDASSDEVSRTAY